MYSTHPDSLDPIIMMEKNSSIIRRFKWMFNISGVGLFFSAYLTYETITLMMMYGPTPGPYSSFFGVPFAFIGLGSFILLFLISGIGAFYLKVNLSRLMWISLVSSFLGVLFTIYLVYIEIVILQAICPFCTVAHLANLGVFLVAVETYFHMRRNKKSVKG